MWVKKRCSIARSSLCWRLRRRIIKPHRALSVGASDTNHLTGRDRVTRWNRALGLGIGWVVVGACLSEFHTPRRDSRATRWDSVCHKE